MIYGHVRDGFPRVMLPLTEHHGPINVEFIVDTGFDGELTVPGSVLTQLQATYITDRTLRMADGSVSRSPVYHAELEWNDELRITEIIHVENPPLLGVQLMEGKFLQSEMTDGGEVSLDDL